MKFLLAWVSATWMVAKIIGALVAVVLAAKWAAAAGDAYFAAFLTLAFTAFIAWERVSTPKPSIKGSHE